MPSYKFKDKKDFLNSSTRLRLKMVQNEKSTANIAAMMEAQMMHSDLDHGYEVELTLVTLPDLSDQFRLEMFRLLERMIVRMVDNDVYEQLATKLMDFFVTKEYIKTYSFFVLQIVLQWSSFRAIRVALAKPPMTTDTWVTIGKSENGHAVRKSADFLTQIISRNLTGLPVDTAFNNLVALITGMGWDTNTNSSHVLSYMSDDGFAEGLGKTQLLTLYKLTNGFTVSGASSKLMETARSSFLSSMQNDILQSSLR